MVGSKVIFDITFRRKEVKAKKKVDRSSLEEAGESQSKRSKRSSSRSKKNRRKDKRKRKHKGKIS